MKISRRDAFGGSAEAGQAKQTATPTPAPAFRGEHRPAPRPFDPAKLNGLSEKLIRSHRENSYGGAFKAQSA